MQTYKEMMKRLFSAIKVTWLFFSEITILIKISC